MSLRPTRGARIDSARSTLQVMRSAALTAPSSCLRILFWNLLIFSHTSQNVRSVQLVNERIAENARNNNSLIFSRDIWPQRLPAATNAPVQGVTDVCMVSGVGWTLLSSCTPIKATNIDRLSVWRYAEFRELCDFAPELSEINRCTALSGEVQMRDQDGANHTLRVLGWMTFSLESRKVDADLWHIGRGQKTDQLPRIPGSRFLPDLVSVYFFSSDDLFCPMLLVTHDSRWRDVWCFRHFRILAVCLCQSLRLPLR
jgi:hypothetical protein